MPRKSESKPTPRAQMVWLVDGEVDLAVSKKARELGVDVLGIGPNRTAADVVVAELTRARGDEGKVVLGASDSALVMAFLSLASAVDAKPDDAQLWRQYRESIDALQGRAREAGVDDEEDWTSAVGAASVRNTKEPRQRNARRAGSGGKPPARPRADAAPAAGVGRRPRGGR